MDKILTWISEYSVLLINAFGLGILVFIAINSARLYGRKNSIEDALRKTIKKRSYNAKTRRLEEEETKEEVSPDRIVDCETEFNKACSGYEAVTQLVPLFPLFGILGTVAGLMLELSATGLEEITNSLKTALDTTFWGLVWAIALKILLTVLPARIIFEVEVMLAEYHKNFQNSIDLKRITED